jgi:thiosulfate dehydrogenase [quinone] large subunit
MTLEQRAMIALAGAHVLIGIFFLFLAHYKLVDRKFIYGGGIDFWLNKFRGSGSVYPFYRSFLESIVQPHKVLFAWLVTLAEAGIALSMLLGLFVRTGSSIGMFLMLNLLLASDYPGPQARVWQYFGASLSHSILLILFAVFFLADAGQVGGLDGFSSSALPALE